MSIELSLIPRKMEHAASKDEKRGLHALEISLSGSITDSGGKTNGDGTTSHSHGNIYVKDDEDLTSPLNDGVQGMRKCNVNEPFTAHMITLSPDFVAKRRWALMLYGIATVLLYADQNLLSPNLTAIADEFQFSAMERDYYLGGQIAIGFWLVGAPASYLVGILGDHFDRTSLFALTVLIGEGACFATYFTRTYTGLYVTRALTGFSVGGALPLIYSLLGDFYPPEERNAVNAVVGMGTGLGISIGQGAAGYLGPIFGWRLPFLIVSTPALLCAAWVWCTVQDPVRGGMDRQYHTSSHLPPVHAGDEYVDEGSCAASEETRQSSSGTSEWHGARCECSMLCCANYFRPTLELLRIPTVLLVLLQGAPGCIPWGIINTYLNDYLSVDKGLTVQSATNLILTFGVGVFLGMSVAGVAGKSLYQRDPRYPQLLAGIMAMVGVIPMYAVLNFVNADTGVFLSGAMAILAGLGSGVTGPIVKATLTNVTLPTSRGAAFALLNTFDDVGRGLGPMGVAMLIMAFDGDRQRAFNVGILGWVLCGLANLAIFFVVKNDEAKMRQTLQTQQNRLG
jgi:MFS family permease